MRLSFNQCCHAFVAFSPPNFRVKAPPPERLRLTRKIDSPKQMLQEIWEKTPQQGDA
jgi:hypothetical protein